MAKKCDHTYLTLHAGTEQSQRLQKSLMPENFNLNDFSVNQWMEFAYNFAKEVNYFGIENEVTPSGGLGKILYRKRGHRKFCFQP